MLAPMLLLGLASSGLHPSANAISGLSELSKGSALYRVCQAEARLMDLPSLVSAASSDLLNGSYCVGYLNGFVANLDRSAAICPQEVPIGVLVRVYVAFMAKNPDLLEKDRRMGLNLALRDAYPCPTETKPGLEASAMSRSAL